MFRLVFFWSLDGELLDDIDPHFVFWAREFEYKDAPSRHLYFGRHPQGTVQEAPNRMDADQGAAQLSKKHRLFKGEHSYATQRHPRCVGAVIPDSTDALTRTRFDWLELARDDNLGAPNCMTTYVGNPRSASVVPHVKHGPCAPPDAEHTLGFVSHTAPLLPGTRYGCLKSAEYLRRRADVEAFGLRTVGLHGHHGELQDLTRRSEGQKRGDQHDHYCLWARSCGYLFSSSLRITGVKHSTRECEKHSASNDAHNSSIPSSGLLHSTEAASSNVEMPHTQICANAA